MAWSGGRATSATLRASVAGALRLRPPAGQRVTAIRSGPLLIRFSEAEGLAQLDMVAGTTYEVSFGAA